MAIKASEFWNFSLARGPKCEYKICLQHNYESKPVDTHANKTIQQFWRISKYFRRQIKILEVKAQSHTHTHTQTRWKGFHPSAQLNSTQLISHINFGLSSFTASHKFDTFCIIQFFCFCVWYFVYMYYGLGES